MSKQFYKDAFVWGFVLWFIGYILGIILFMAVPSSLIGWIITPIGILITLWVLFRKIHAKTFPYYGWLAAIWVIIAVVCDYVFLVQLFKPEDGYYKLDVYLYYALTAVLPLIAGWKKSAVKNNTSCS